MPEKNRKKKKLIDIKTFIRTLLGKGLVMVSETVPQNERASQKNVVNQTEKSELEQITEEILGLLQDRVKRKEYLTILDNESETGKLYKILFKDVYELNKVRDEISLINQYGSEEKMYLLAHGYDPNLQNRITHALKLFLALLKPNFNLENYEIVHGESVEKLESLKDFLNQVWHITLRLERHLAINEIKDLRTIEEERIKNEAKKIIDKNNSDSALQVYSQRIRHLRINCFGFFVFNWIMVVVIMTWGAIVLISIFFKQQILLDSLNSKLPFKFELNEQPNTNLAITGISLITSVLFYSLYFINKNYRSSLHLYNQYIHKKMSYEIIYFQEDSLIKDKIIKDEGGLQWWRTLGQQYFYNLLQLPDDGMIKQQNTENDNSNITTQISDKINKISDKIDGK
jgi:hypothetical protein